MKKNIDSFNSVLLGISKNTNIYSFLKAVPHLNPLSEQSIYQLADRFNISPKSFAVLISIAMIGGCYHEN